MSCRWIVLAALVTTLVAGQARAQLFGARSLGNTLSRSSGAGDSFSPLSTSGAQGTDFAQFGQGGTLSAQAASGAGQLSGNERFLRGNRRGGSFVGTDAARPATLCRHAANPRRRRGSLGHEWRPRAAHVQRQPGSGAGPSVASLRFAVERRFRVYRSAGGFAGSCADASTAPVARDTPAWPARGVGDRPDGHPAG